MLDDSQKYPGRWVIFVHKSYMMDPYLLSFSKLDQIGLLSYKYIYNHIYKHNIYIFLKCS